MKNYGTRAAFRMLGVGAAVVASLYFAFNYLYIKRKHANDEKKGSKSNQTKDLGDYKAESGLGNPGFVPDEIAKVNDNSNAKNIRSVD